MNRQLSVLHRFSRKCDSHVRAESCSTHTHTEYPHRISEQTRPRDVRAESLLQPYFEGHCELHSGAPRSEPHLERTLAAIEAAGRIRIHVVRDVDDSAWANVGCSLRVIQNRLRAFQAGENKYQITGGTGKMKGISLVLLGKCRADGHTFWSSRHPRSWPFSFASNSNSIRAKVSWWSNRLLGQACDGFE